MIVKAYRIIQEAHIESALSGEGAAMYGGRWNHQGTPIIYSSSTLSLATLEIIVNLHDVKLVNNLYSIEIEFDSTFCQFLERSILPIDWERYPSPAKLKNMGTKWAQETASLVLAVPSAVMASELNYLINPNHPDFDKLTIYEPVPYRMDSRVVDRLR